MKPWPKISTRKLADYRIFSIRSDLKRSPRTETEMDFYVIEASSWVNVIPVLPDGRLVMIEQFRHGTDTLELEIPGGVMDKADASPIEAGIRELREETGYEGHGASLIGRTFPNPAIMNNTCYTVLVRDCEMRHPTHFDHGEDIRTVIVDPAELPQFVAEGRIGHALVVVALYHYQTWLATDGLSSL